MDEQREDLEQPQNDVSERGPAEVDRIIVAGRDQRSQAENRSGWRR
jgi:hypothetical protein